MELGQYEISLRDESRDHHRQQGGAPDQGFGAALPDIVENCLRQGTFEGAGTVQRGNRVAIGAREGMESATPHPRIKLCGSKSYVVATEPRSFTLPCLDQRIEELRGWSAVASRQ
jgi:hypothetical protein